ncbi:MAG: hypothetical protein WCB53_03925 [Terriglobales bacterium]
MNTKNNKAVSGEPQTIPTIPAATECHFTKPNTKSIKAQIEKKTRGVGRFISPALCSTMLRCRLPTGGKNMSANGIFQQLLFAFSDPFDSDVLRWPKVLTDIMNNFRSVEYPSVIEIAFRTRAGQRRRAERFFEMALKQLIGSGQVWARGAVKLERNQPAKIWPMEVKAQIKGHARKSCAVSCVVAIIHLPQV